MKGEVVGEIELKSDANVFYEMFRYKTHLISTMSPDKISEVALHQGEWGAINSQIQWRFILDGKESFSKEIIEAIDEENKIITLKAIQGNLMELYKSFKFVVHFDMKGCNNLLRLTLKFEKLNNTIPEPTIFMDFCLKVFKDIENYYLMNLMKN